MCSRAESRSRSEDRPITGPVLPRDSIQLRRVLMPPYASVEVVDELERVDLGKMNLQLIANEENQDRAQCGKNEAGGMISFVCRARKYVGNAPTDDRSDDAEHDRPENS